MYLENVSIENVSMYRKCNLIFLLDIINLYKFNSYFFMQLHPELQDSGMS